MNDKKGGSLVARPVMKSLRVGQGANLCRVYNYHDSRAYSYKWSGILPKIDGFGMVLVWLWHDIELR
jgi:hypothetical protein